MKIKLSFIIFFLLIFLVQVIFSQNTVYMEFLISKEGNVSLVTYYIFEGDFDEIFDNNGKIRIEILNEKDNSIKTVFINYTPEDFVFEYFSPKEGKIKIENEYTIKRVKFILPSNSSKIVVYSNSIKQLEFKIENRTIIPEELKNVTRTYTEESLPKRAKNTNLIIYIIIPIIAILLIVFVLFIKRRHAP